jgi:hypothetical protein
MHHTQLCPVEENIGKNNDDQKRATIPRLVEEAPASSSSKRQEQEVRKIIFQLSYFFFANAITERTVNANRVMKG